VSVVTFLSAKGSPGVTTTAALTAALWPRSVVLLEADPAGGDLAARRGLRPAQILQHTQTLAGGTRAVVGLGSSEQALAAGAGWGALARAAGELDRGTEPVDLVVDAGRVEAGSVHLDLLRASDVVVLVVRAQTAAVLHARERLRVLGGALRRADGLLPRVGLVVVADARREARDADQAAEILTGVGPWIDDLGRLPWDPAGAAVFCGGRTSRPERTALVRAGRGLVAELSLAAGAERAA